MEELLQVFPGELRAKGELKVPSGMSEQALKSHLAVLGGKNTSVNTASSFLGAGAYNHYTPSVVKHLAGRSEFYTAYTPYQPEISQGTLQAIFEYQTLICQLTAMDVSNASLYDGASAVAEGVLMARRLKKGSRVLLSSALHPEYRETVKTYLKETIDDITELPYDPERGVTLSGAVDDLADGEAACLVIQYPNFFGTVEDLAALAEKIHAKGGLLLVAVSEGISLGTLTPPGDLNCDIVVGEGQSFGCGLNFGGPYLGFIGAKEEFLRQMPGRIVGETVDNKGHRAFCLTLATREQHIRRDRATSNICTNEGLCALMASIYLSALGSKGLRELGTTNISKAEYLKGLLTSTEGIALAFDSPTFNEFVIKVDCDVDPLLDALLDESILGGLHLKRFYPELDGHLLVTVTEMNGREEMERFASLLGSLLKQARQG